MEGKERILRAKNLVADAFHDPIHSAGCRQWLACSFVAIYSFWWFGHYLAQSLGKYRRICPRFSKKKKNAKALPYVCHILNCEVKHCWAQLVLFASAPCLRRRVEFDARCEANVLRSHHSDYTASHPNCEVKHCWAQLVLQWGTMRESWVS